MAEISTFRFRGSRDYLHSSTIFDHLLSSDPAPQKIDFTFHKLTNRQCEIEPESDPNRATALAATYLSAGAQHYLYEAAAPIELRYPCNEGAIARQLVVRGETAQFDMPPVEGASYIESIVGAYKTLLIEGPERCTRKLLFARVLLEYVPTDGVCSVAHRRKIGEDFFEGSLTHRGVTMGRLFFGAT
jgi:hypothetical protein